MSNAVSDSYGAINDAAQSFSKGEIQPKKCRDVVFAILFLAHLGGMAYFLAEGIGDAQFDYSGLASTVSLCGAFAVAITTVSLSIMMLAAHLVIKMALFFSLGVSLVVAVQGFVSGGIFVGIVGTICFCLMCVYVYFVMPHIPFAASNMKTAISAVKDNLGLLFVTTVFLIVAFGWIVWWSIAAGEAMSNWAPGIILLFLLSYYWTHQVIQNTLLVTAAGVVGTWWYTPIQANSCCSSALKDSYIRSITTSFGSVCMGSLLVSIFKAIRDLNRMAKTSDKCRIIACCLDCILGCIGRIIEYFNQWAFVYCGLYGYGYVEAGRNVQALFENRGWTAIISDDLVDKTLFMFSLAIGLLTGLTGLFLATASPNVFGGIGFDEDFKAVGFTVGTLVGFLLSKVMLSVIGSAVDTVVVCFAEAPAEFEANHPVLSAEMRNAWRTSYPVECGNL